ncbi:MAG: hypothetical protein ACOX6S_14805 [Clostridia bacterium]|jgi:hypothetical protein
MKNTRLVLVVVVAALVLMGAGYAAWTQTFSIQSTVSTGELFVKVSEGEHKVEIENVDGEIAPGETENFLEFSELHTETTTDKSGDITTLTELKFTLEGMYPGVKQTSVLKFQNLGTLKTVTELNGSPSYEGDITLLDKLDIRVNEGSLISGNGAEKLNNLAEAIRAAVGELDLEDLKTVTVVIELPLKENETDNSAEGLSLTWEIPLIFEQYNANNNTQS